MPVTETWQRFDIRRIEDLKNAVLGAELEAIQMAGPPVRGSLAFAAAGGIVYGSGLIDGNVALCGSLSEVVTFAVLLAAGPGSRLRFSEAKAGTVGVCLPGDEVDLYLTAGTLYLTITLSRARLARKATPGQFPRIAEILRTTGIHTRPMAGRSLDGLRDQALALHQSGRRPPALGRTALMAILEHYMTHPPKRDNAGDLRGGARIVHLAQAFIRDNLAAPITTEALADAAETSPRSLYRAFSTILGDTPQGYVRRLRLHRVRHRLLSASQPACSIVAAARPLGLDGDMGRLSVRYRTLFGEPPSATLAERRLRDKSLKLI